MSTGIHGNPATRERDRRNERIDQFRVPEQAKLRVIRVSKNDAPDPALDNEPADIHSDGVQAYLADPERYQT